MPNFSQLSYHKQVSKRSTFLVSYVEFHFVIGFYYYYSSCIITKVAITKTGWYQCFDYLKLINWSGSVFNLFFFTKGVLAVPLIMWQLPLFAQCLVFLFCFFVNCCMIDQAASWHFGQCQSETWTHYNNKHQHSIFDGNILHNFQIITLYDFNFP